MGCAGLILYYYGDIIITNVLKMVNERSEFDDKLSFSNKNFVKLVKDKIYMNFINFVDAIET